ncbi:MAG: pirin family protein [Flavobacteriales bacterium]|nr:pirin family protein [Flavobacteriales bacterium]
MTKTLTLHRADTRGHADHGWLDTWHTFSFAEYHDPSRVHFGTLRVLNDDTVAPGMGFGTHPHDNMEIVSIPLEGDLEHKDSMGHVQVIHQGDVQVMSAGTGITHSERARDHDKPVRFLQIWVIPRERNVAPRYDQMTLPAGPDNALMTIISPDANDGGLWMHQDAWFQLGRFAGPERLTYAPRRPGNGVYAFLIEGDATIAGQDLHRRDGMGIEGEAAIDIRIGPKGGQLLLIDVPMALN